MNMILKMSFARIGQGFGAISRRCRKSWLIVPFVLLWCGVGLVAEGEEAAVQQISAAQSAGSSVSPETGEGAEITEKTNAPENAPEPAEKPDAAAKKTLTEFGESYVLNSSQRSDVLNTEEYILAGQTPENWSQAIIYQRIAFSAPAAPDSLVGSIKKRIEEVSPRSQLRLVSQGKSASIFAVHYAKTAQQPEQVAIALAAVADPKRPNELHLIQFALRPDRLDLATMERLVKRWQARFQSQAASLNR